MMRILSSSSTQKEHEKTDSLIDFASSVNNNATGSVYLHFFALAGVTLIVLLVVCEVSQPFIGLVSPVLEGE